ncbi:aldose epimerase family protein [Roseateles saccharophilus]|uniref:Aldose 1-epimerase n=1 Tax=Roseateles saccharophilus TaxID=304 RepID=A0A4R3UFI1_ROSSA|nr:aldose epimerase family protein [Roseateles saccharophilus]MDG0834824.1 galactose mutarotase [Roseateles saccharophilus]TCU88947.1 aldose 1-epimerase [Roseateles saccharophilus]
MEVRDYGHLPDGRPVHEYTLANGLGLRLTAITLGGIVTGLWVPDAHGQAANVVLGFDNLDDYVHRNPSFGIIVGRYGNRIAGASFELDGETHALSRNDGPNCLHGGVEGFGHRLWQAEPDAPRAGEAVALLLHDTSPHGDQGFPGELRVSVRYALSATENSWRIDYEATTDRATVVNLTHHDYFNLAGHGSVLRHRLTLPASRYSEVDEHLIPLCHAAVEGTPFDFRRPTPIVARLREAHPQLLRARGYDHNWLLDGRPGADGLRPAATLEDPHSGRRMDVLTTEPALQFYSGNFLDGSLAGPGGRVYRQGDGLCLETQHNPDSPHHEAGSDWPSTVLRPGETWRSTTIHCFT